MEVKLSLTGRPATQSSNYVYTTNGDVAVASRAIDGNYNPNFFAKSCTHTDDAVVGSSWWRVDLGQPVKVQQVMVVIRGDCCGRRSSNSDASTCGVGKVLFRPRFLPFEVLTLSSLLQMFNNVAFIKFMNLFE